MAAYETVHVNVEGIGYECEFIRYKALPGNETDRPEPERINDLTVYLTLKNGDKEDMTEDLSDWVMEQIEEKLLEANK